MLAVAPLRGSNGEERGMGDAGDFSMLEDFSDRALLEDINFDDIFVGFDVDGDILPDLEVDPNEILAEFSVGGEEESGTTATTTDAGEGMPSGVVDVAGSVQGEVLMEGGGSKDEDRREPNHSEEALSSTAAKDPVAAPSSEVRSASPEAERGRKHSAASGKSAHGKRKVKVDWTPELHRRFVQAVEQLGVDKAVPSRILELMGIDCLTRHNIASHLQKYRSHRKHLLAREAEAASWSQRRQIYAPGGGSKRDINPWLAPTIGFPPAPPPPTPTPAAAAPAVQAYRPLHVWGHPTMEQPLVPMWPRHLAPRTPTPAWAPQLPLPSPPPPDASYWHHHYQRGAREGWIPHAMTQGTPCFPQPLPTTKFPAPAVAGIVPHAMYRPVPPPMASKQPTSQLQLETHPSKESIDAAIGDVLKKPLSPLPLGLKPPSLDSVLVELQKQGVSKVPPPTCTT